MSSSTGSIWGDRIDGRHHCEQRSITMSETTPPKDFTWNNNDNSPDDEEFTTRRLAFLDQFDLEISQTPEKGYRVWRWLGDDTLRPSGYNSRSGRLRIVRWSERRPWSDPLPTRPGLWPRNQ